MKVFVSILALTCCSVVSGYYIYLSQNRFYLQASSDSLYRIDRATGDTWKLSSRPRGIAELVTFENVAQRREELSQIEAANKLRSEQADHLSYLEQHGYTQTAPGYYVQSIESGNFLKDADGNLVNDLKMARLLIDSKNRR